jgi:hypothetical protein
LVLYDSAAVARAVRRNHLGAELDEELRDHIDRQIEDNLARGMSPEEARLAALRKFGNPALLRDQTRATWNWNGLEQFARDAHIGIRTLSRTPGFAIRYKEIVRLDQRTFHFIISTLCR